MHQPNSKTSMRLLTAAAGTLVLLAGPSIPLFDTVGRGAGTLILAGLCIVILVVLVPVVFRADWKVRLLALALAVFPALMLLSTLLFSKAFIR